jgi:hypothetical protein
MNSAVILNEHDDGVIDVNGKPHMADAKGHLVPVDLIKPADKIEDEQVRKVMAFALELSAQIGRFRVNTMADLDGVDSILEQEYGVSKGGLKGNRTYQSFDGLMKVSVQVAEHIDFGPQLQIAKELIDECLNEWSEASDPKIRTIVTRAFNTDQEGKINKSEIFMLMRLDIEDPRWLKAMDAIRDAMRVTGSKEYVRFYQRRSIKDGWTAVTIDLAKAGA